MKYLIKFILVAAAAVFMTGCSGGISGDYGGEGCLYQKMTFTNDGTAYITMFGMESSYPYKVDGDKISINMMGSSGSVVFTRSGNAIEAMMLGEKMICKKL